jgi:protein TonB
MLKRLHLICKQPTMTSNEILKADVLDILFENRNKQYGAYALRKYYNNRMMLALGISLAAVLLACLLIRPGEKVDVFDNFLNGPVKVSPPIELRPVEPTPPPAAATPRPVATQAFSSRIEIVSVVPPGQEVPEIGDLVDRQIGNMTVEGVPPTENRTIEEPAPQPATTTGATEAAPPVFQPVERMPEFPGGVGAWTNFLGRHLRMPEELEAGERRTVQVKFWVGTDGSIDRFEVVQSAGAAFDSEVIRVLKKMPKWKPAIQNGQPIAITFTQPVTFQALEE